MNLSDFFSPIVYTDFYDADFNYFQQLKLHGNIKHIKQIAFSNQNYHSKKSLVDLKSTAMNNCEFFLDENGRLEKHVYRTHSHNIQFISHFENKNLILREDFSEDQNLSSYTKHIRNSSNKINEILSYKSNNELSKKIVFLYDSIGNLTDIKEENSNHFLKKIIYPNENKIFHIVYHIINGSKKELFKVFSYEYLPDEDCFETKVLRVEKNSDFNDIFAMTPIGYHKKRFDSNQNIIFEEDKKNGTWTKSENQYDEKQKIIQRSTYNLQDNSRTIRDYNYEDNKLMNELIIETDRNGRKYQDQILYKYGEFGHITERKLSWNPKEDKLFQYVFDDKHNWIECDLFINKKLFQKTNRIIEYI